MFLEHKSKNRFRILKKGKISLVVSALIASSAMGADQTISSDKIINSYTPDSTMTISNGTSNITVSNGVTFDNTADGSTKISIDINTVDYIGTIFNDGNMTANRVIVNLDDISNLGTIENNGTMNSIDNTAIYITNDNNGSVVNNGNINAEWYAINIDGTNNGDIVNNGDINSSDISMYIYYDNGVNGNIINNGSIISDNSYGNIFVEENNDGNITNNGTIVNTSTDGIQIYYDNNGNIVNDGNITAGNNGIYVDRDNNGIVTNTATITADAIGIDAGTNNGTVINSGTITANEIGIESDTNTNGSIINSGTITTLGTTWNDAVISAIDGNVTNTTTGVLNGSVNVANSTLINSGVINGDIITGSLDNSDGDITANGIRFATSLINSGDITVDGDITKGAGVSRLLFATSDIFNNSGDINATGSINLSLTDAINSGTINSNKLYTNKSLTNSGTMIISSDMYAIDDINNSGDITTGSLMAMADLVNSGTIDGNITATNFVNTASGTITTDSLGFISSFSNSGTIVVNGNIEKGVLLGKTLYAVNNFFDNDGNITADNISTELDITNSGNITIDGNITAKGLVNSANSSITTDKLILSSDLNNSGVMTIESLSLDKDSQITNSGDITLNGELSKTVGTSIRTMVNSGTFDIEEHIYISDNINNSGTLEAQKILAMDIVNSGTLSFTDSNSSNYTHISSLIMENNSTMTLALDVADDNSTAVHNIKVNTDATIGDGVTFNFDVQADENSSKKLFENNATIFLSAAGNLDVNLSNIIVTDTSALMDFEVQYDKDDNNSLTVKALAGLAEEASLVSYALDAVGAAIMIDKVALGKEQSSSSDVNDFITQLRLLKTKEEVAKEVLSTTPMGTVTSSTVNNQVVQSAGNIVGNRVSSFRGENSGDVAFSDKNMWIKPFGGKSTQDNKDGFTGFESSFRGIGFGFDGEISDDRRVGVALFYTDVTTDTNDISNQTKTDSYNLMTYGVMPIVDDLTDFSWNIGLGMQKVDINKYIESVNKTATADYSTKTLSASAKVSRAYRMNDKLKLVPAVSGTFTHFRSPSYSETGAGGLNQHVQAYNTNTAIVAVEASANYSIDDNTQLLASFGIDYNLNNDRSKVSSSYEGMKELVFETEGIKTAPESYKVGLGLNRKIDDDRSFNIDYNLEKKTTDFTNHGVSAKFEWKF
jgi:outer membrane autotransporter protein